MTRSKSRYQKIDIDLSSRGVTLYVGSKVRSALEELTTDVTLYHGVRLREVMEAMYEQGLKDGRKEIIEKLEGIKTGVNYLPPGRPRKRKKT